MRRWQLTSWLFVGMVGFVPLPAVHADLFDTARQAIRTDLGRADRSGVTVRGGASLTSGVSPGSTTLLRGQAQIGGACGAFDFSTSITQAFQELPGLFEA